jgi:hypothetical protein
VTDHSQPPVTFPLGFGDLAGKEVVAAWDGGEVTSDAGLLLLRQIDEQWGLTPAIVAEMEDLRQPGKVVHSLEELVRTRVYGIAQGYSDCNDMVTLRVDPPFQVSSGLLPTGLRWRVSRHCPGSRTP